MMTRLSSKKLFEPTVIASATSLAIVFPTATAVVKPKPGRERRVPVLQ
jgi:hypothetical protein